MGQETMPQEEVFRSRQSGPGQDAPGFDAFRHWRGRYDEGGILWLALDRAEASLNTLSEDVLEELDTALARVEAEPPRALILHSAKANGFLAGADIREFADLSEKSVAEARIRKGRTIFDRLAGLPVPTVALVHGFCVGGGLELALACRYRVARDDARLGLPEVQLGIHPGFGGTVRLTRLLPPPLALDLILTGRTVDAARAKRMGLVDVVTQDRHLRAAARDAALNGVRGRRHRTAVALLNSGLARPVIARLARRKLAGKVRPEHYPAPFAAIELWRRHGGSPKRMLEAETDSIAALIGSPTAQNLVRVFFLRERLKSLGREAEFSGEHIHVFGAGTMGGDIAAWCVLRGFRVTLQDVAPKQVAPAVARAARLFRQKLKSERRVREALDRLIPDVPGDGLARAALVIEAIPEDPEAKRALFRQIEPRLRTDALLATNTSSIPLEELAAALKNPNRLIGLHFFNPVARMPLVEVVGGPESEPAALRRGMAFAQRIDRLPLPVESGPGFLVNRVLTPYLLEAVLMVEEGIAPAKVDAVARAFGMPMGPLELADRVGLDVCLHVGEILSPILGREVPAKLRALVGEGRLGRKSGRGFYAYGMGRGPRPPGNASRDASEEIQDRLILPLLDACVACLRQTVVADGDLLDAGMVFGAGFAPFRGGPMRYIQERGPRELRRRLETLEVRHGGRFRADPGWADLPDASRPPGAGAD